MGQSHFFLTLEDTFCCALLPRVRYQTAPLSQAPKARTNPSLRSQHSAASEVLAGQMDHSALTILTHIPKSPGSLCGDPESSNTPPPPPRRPAQMQPRKGTVWAASQRWKQGGVGGRKGWAGGSGEWQGLKEHCWVKTGMKGLGV